MNSQALLRQLYKTDQLPITVQKPWGYEVILACTDEQVTKILHVNRGEQLSLQYHQRKKETSRLLIGRVVLAKGPNCLERSLSAEQIMEELRETVLRPGATWTNNPGEVHTVRAIVSSDIQEVSTPELDDVVRIVDNYGRAGTSAP